MKQLFIIFYIVVCFVCKAYAQEADLCGGKRGPIIISRIARVSFQRTLENLSRKADLVRYETTDLMGNIELEFPIVGEVVQITVPSCLNFIDNRTILNNDISKLRLIDIHFNMLLEAREVLDKLKLSMQSVGLDQYSRRMRVISNYVKSLMCEITKIMHITGYVVPNTTRNNIQLCQVLGIVQNYKQAYFLLDRLAKLASTLVSQYNSFVPGYFLE